MSPTWALPVPLLPDELFSSWLARASLAQGCDPLALTGNVWPGWRVWVRDPDRGVSSDKLKPLTKVSGIGEAAFEAATLRPIASAVAGGALNGKTMWPWMLALGSRNRRRHGGLQYCPACLAEDKSPYYRLQWRLAWHTACGRHASLLLDRCPYCGAPLEPHRLSAIDEHLALCAQCKRDLGDALLSHAAPEAFAFQRAADDAVFRLEGAYGQERVSCEQWFAIARHFVGLLRKAALGKPDVLRAIAHVFDIDAGSQEIPATGLALELLPVRERAALLGSAWKMLNAGPDALLRAAQEAGAKSRTLYEPCHALPNCPERFVAALPERTRTIVRKASVAVSGPRSHQTVARMWARLQRKMLAEAR